MTKDKIYHITTRTAWKNAMLSGEYWNSSLEEVGFIHCAYLNQVVNVANKFYKGQNDLVLVGINRDKVDCKVIDEDLYNLNEEFPHVYGAIPINSVFEITPFPCKKDGAFSLQDEEPTNC